MASGDATTRIIVDQYSPLSHKQLVGDPHTNIQGLYAVPGWVPTVDRRRLSAYLVRAAYRANVSRLLLPADPVVVRDPLNGRPTSAFRDDSRREHREYGDADLLIDRGVAGVLGDQWQVIVEGADDDLPDTPELPPKPQEPDAGADPIETRIYTTASTRWQTQASDIVDEWEADWQARPALQQRQDELRKWADDVQLAARLDEAEHDCVGLGDTVIVAWPREGDWPRLAVYDPGFYFPVLEDAGDDEDYPTKVHLAWEYGLEGTQSARPTHIRRITFELVDLTSLHTAGDPESRYWVDANGEQAAAPDLNAAEEVDEQGRVFRRLPWDVNIDGSPVVEPGPIGDNGEPSEVERRSYRTCLVSDGTWEIAGVGGDVLALDDSRAQWKMRHLDLGCDFLPLVHVPNTPSGKEHYGRALIDPVAQVLDDLAQSDTDVTSAARFSSGPVLALAGAKMDGAVTEIRPGIAYNLGENGRMDVLDLSKGLTALIDQNEKLQGRLDINGRVPAAIKGRISSNRAISGVVLALEMAPFAQLIGVMRMSRQPKHSLLLTMVQRLAQLQGMLPAGPSLDARVAYGNFMPGDVAAVVTMVAQALTAKAISTQTGVAMLVAAGLPVEDASAEVDRIHAEDATAALAIANATGSEQLAADWLDLELPEPVGGTPPAITLPPVPVVPGQPPPF